MIQRGPGPLPHRLNRRDALRGAAGLALGGALVAGCGRSEAPVDDQGRIRLRLAADGPAQAAHGGFYQAVASGAYERRGLNVQIIPVPDVAQRLASGAVELGLAPSSFVPLGLVAERAPVKAVAAFFQKDLSALIAPPDPAVESIADLAGRPIVADDPARNPVWAWLKARYGFTDDQARAPDAGPDDPRAARLAALTAEPGEAEARVWLLADDGYPSYGAMVLAPNAFARDNGAALRAFIAASAEGWRDYVRGDAAAVRGAAALIRQANPEMTDARLEQARAALRDHGVVDDGDAALYGLGAMTEDRWRAFFEAAALAGVEAPDQGWRDAFTNAYLPGRG